QPPAISEATIRAALGNPDWVSDVTLRADGEVTVILQADPDDLARSETRRIEVETRVMSMDGVTNVRAVLTAERAPTEAAVKTVPAGPKTRRVRKGARLSDEALQQGTAPPSGQINAIEGIARILVVASAKGGVGKSTVSTNLAAIFAKQGLRVGLLDADIYGPSIPTMLGVENHSPQTNADGKLVPVEAHGIASLSIGYLTDPDAPMIWRGPIVQSAIMQMLNDAAWGRPDDPLDLLIIDTPPGTGEAQLTLAQRVPVTASILVTTPQDVALADVQRGAAMFAKTHVPVLGLVETMSWFEDPAGTRHALLGDGGGQRMADALGLPLLAQLPIIQAIREGGDAGHPAALVDAQTETLFTALARDIALALDALQTKPAPEFVFE
ncbi:MAG: P-loop NTPase, partial [Pseudomonadota bacterium]